MKLCDILAIASAVLGVVSATPQRGDYVLTPAGPIHHSCVHKVGSGVSVRSVNGLLHVVDDLTEEVRILPKCSYPYAKSVSERSSKHRHHHHPHPHRPSVPVSDDPFPSDYDGWTSYTAYNTTSIDSFLGKFSVPDAPATSPDILYIFTGLQNLDWIPIVDPEQMSFDIIQPVLQYPADAGNGWSVKSWYVTVDSGAVQSDEVLVQPGDTIFGNMTRTGSTSWYIGSTSVLTKQSTYINVDYPRLQYQPWAYNTIECYGCVDCSTYPSTPCEFTELALYEGDNEIEPVWAANPKPSKNHFCKEEAIIHSPDHVTFQFN